MYDGYGTSSEIKGEKQDMGEIICIVLIIIFAIIALKNSLAKKTIIKTFAEKSVQVAGARGSGKDMLFNYVIDRRKRTYISNVQYAEFKEGDETSLPRDKKWIRLDPLKQWTIGGNTIQDFINGTIQEYEYPYADGIDYYVSDVGVYLPAQENSLLNKKYPSMPLFQALLRHLGDANFHMNAQAFNRPWDKVREQAESYILCRKCKVTFGRFVTQRLTIYERYQSACDKLQPMRRGIGKQARLQYQQFTAEHGEIKNIKIRYILRHKYDSRRFKTILRGEKNEATVEME